MFLLHLRLAAGVFCRLKIVRKRYKSLKLIFVLFSCLGFGRRRLFPIEYFVNTCKIVKLFETFTFIQILWYFMTIEQIRNLCNLACRLARPSMALQRGPPESECLLLVFEQPSEVQSEQHIANSLRGSWFRPLCLSMKPLAFVERQIGVGCSFVHGCLKARCPPCILAEHAFCICFLGWNARLCAGPASFFWACLWNC